MALLLVGAVASPGSAAAAAKPLPQQWWFISWGVEDRLWPAAKGQGVTVAVIDTGVQADIPELSGAVLPGIDPETGTGDARTDNNSNFGSPGHGTRMATLIASRGGRTGFMGVAPEARILPVVAQSAPAYAKGIRYAADQGAKVINLSQAVAGPCPSDLQQAVTYALSKDSIVVAGAGNDGQSDNQSMHPANCAGVLAVGAVDGQFRPWVKTQRQSYVTIAAPGVTAGSVSSDGQYRPNYSGTSQASALTSAVVALVRSKFPNMSNREVVQQVIGSAMDVGPKGKDSQSGFGFIRPYRIFNGMVPKNGPNPVFAAYDQQPKPQEQTAGGKTQEPSKGGGPKGGADMASVIFLVAGAVVGVVVLVVMVLVTLRRRKKGKPAPVGPVPGAPPSFGTPYQAQGHVPQQGQAPQGNPQGYPQQGPPLAPGQSRPQAPQGPPQGVQAPATHMDIPQQPRTQQDIPQQPPHQ